jgi:hypothetical protein
VFHVSQLRRYHDPTEHFADRKYDCPPPIKVNKKPKYDVEQLIGKRTKKTRAAPRVEYLIKWKGYTEHDNTWEPETNLTNAQDLIKEFESSRRGQRAEPGGK